MHRLKLAMRCKFETAATEEVQGIDIQNLPTKCSFSECILIFRRPMSDFFKNLIPSHPLYFIFVIKTNFNRVEIIFLEILVSCSAKLMLHRG